MVEGCRVNPGAPSLIPPAGVRSPSEGPSLLRHGPSFLVDEAAMVHSQSRGTVSREPAHVPDAARWRCQGGDRSTAVRLMLVHDRMEHRLELRAMLEALSHQVIGEAGDAETARRQARQLRPDLVLLPISLGGEDTFATAEAISREADIPVF